MSQLPDEKDVELRRLHAEADARERDIRDMDERDHRQETLIARLRGEAAVHAGDVAALRERLEAAEHELEDLRAIRDALTPPELPQRPGLDLAAAFLPAAAEGVSGDFYLVAEGPQDSTVHPTLLPAFPGRRSVERAVAHGVRVHGVTVHKIDEDVDSGPILAQATLAVDDHPDAAEVRRRLAPLEAQLLAEVVRNIASGRG